MHPGPRSGRTVCDSSVIPHESHPMNQPVDIAGGGVAGLALGLALRRAGVPVRVHEAGAYPRHRLCGEFLSGAGAAEFAALGLDDVLVESPALHDAAWFSGDRLILRRDLPVVARGISRWKLDDTMASRLTALGGTVSCGDRVSIPGGCAGWVIATGRARAESSPWFAQKEHYTNLPMHAGLEMHLCKGGYAGLAKIENGTGNVCAMLPAALGKSSSPALSDRLRACGLSELASRLDAADSVPASRCGVSHFLTGWQPQDDGALRIGDHTAVIPPFTGHGMSMAILSALEAAPHLTAWSSGRRAWEETVKSVRTALHRKFRSRLRWAAWLHPFLLRPSGQFSLRFLARSGLLPWQWLFEKVR